MPAEARAAGLCHNPQNCHQTQGLTPGTGVGPQAIPDHPGFLAVAGSPVVDGAAADLVGAAVIREGWRVFCGVRKAGVRRRLKGRVGVGEGLLRAAGRAGRARDRPRAGWSGVWRRSSARRLLAPGFPRRTDGASRNARFAGDPGHRAALPVGHGDQPIAGRRGRGFARFRRVRPRPPRRSGAHTPSLPSVCCARQRSQARQARNRRRTASLRHVL